MEYNTENKSPNISSEDCKFVSQQIL